MRKISIMAMLLALSSIAFTQNSDEEKIRKTIQTEVDAIVARNLEAWKSTWKQDKMATSTFAGLFGNSSIRGWDSLNAIVQRDLKSETRFFSSLKPDSIDIRANDNLAIVQYDMIVTPAEIDPKVYPYTDVVRNKMQQVLVKENGEWKTISRVLIQQNPYAEKPDHAAESNINTAGYDLLAAKKFSEAIEVLKLNVKLYPNSWNTFDSLGEAYMMAGNKKLAIENYEKSVKLNPKNDTGKEALVKLKK